MIRTYQQVRGFRFSLDCPDHVKVRTVVNNGFADTNPKIPACDAHWVTSVNELVWGWWVPGFGFISDVLIQSFKAKFVATLQRIVPFKCHW